MLAPTGSHRFLAHYAAPNRQITCPMTQQRGSTLQ